MIKKTQHEMLVAPLLSPDIMEQRILNWDVPLRCLIIYSEFEEIIKFLKKVKEDKPPFVHKIHKRQLNLGPDQTSGSMFNLKNEQATCLEI